MNNWIKGKPTCPGPYWIYNDRDQLDLIRIIKFIDVKSNTSSLKMVGFHDPNKYDLDIIRYHIPISIPLTNLDMCNIGTFCPPTKP